VLRHLAVRDIVLIDRLDLDFASGLSVLTGETGAGKSILLDALGLALGGRADSSLVRHGVEQGSVAAEFAIPPDHPARAIVAEQGLDTEDPERMVLRRVLGKDGRGRAFVDDQPVSVGLLARIGQSLVEIHGQHDERGLLAPAGHRALLDAFGGLGQDLARMRAAHAAWADAVAALDTAQAELAAARSDEDYLRHVAAELDALAPEAGEEERLAEERHGLMQGEKLGGDLEEAANALDQGGGIEARLRSVQRRLERVAERAGGRLDAVLSALERAAVEAGEATAALDAARRALDHDPQRLEQVEERLFALRAAARKHQVTVDELPALAERMRERIASIDTGDVRVRTLAEAEAKARVARAAAVEALTAARKAAAKRLDAGVAKELDALKLGKAQFRTSVEPLPEAQWTAEGGARVAFEVATNPGAPFGPLIKIASGGELARFILALKVVLARAGSAPTLVFDEVDRGIGGAVAAAVGERLSRLAEGAQVLVVTHSPQVAARGANHFRISKDERKGAAFARVTPLDTPARREEIARMLAGAEITEAARAAAGDLMGVGRG
jgi:DNA repair protein RecN (Recombination protein N)